MLANIEEEQAASVLHDVSIGRKYIDEVLNHRVRFFEQLLQFNNSYISQVNDDDAIPQSPVLAIANQQLPAHTLMSSAESVPVHTEHNNTQKHAFDRVNRAKDMIESMRRMGACNVLGSTGPMTRCGPWLAEP